MTQSEMTYAMSRGRAGLLRLLLLGALASLLAGCGVNAIPTKEEQAKAAWSEVENQYQRRADLVPNLVATVQGFADQEREVLTAVTEARAEATSVTIDADTITDPAAFQRFEAAQDQLTSALSRLIAVAENYPTLTSSQNFLTLQSQLEGTENRIAVARRDYIAAVQAYNTELRTFPGRLWAATFYRGSEPMQTFTADEGASQAPSVSFD